MRLPPSALAAIVIAATPFLRADDAPAAAPAPALPPSGFSADRYAVLWTNSPFAVATSENAVNASPDYFLVGIANVEGISYASVIERQNQEHFLISTDKPTRGLTLKSINRSHDDTFAEVLKDGQSITLKLEQAPAGQNGNTMANLPGMPPPMPQMGMPGGIPLPSNMPPQIPMPGGPSGFPNINSVRPFARFHRPAIHLPPMVPPMGNNPQIITPPPPPPPQ